MCALEMRNFYLVAENADGPILISTAEKYQEYNWSALKIYIQQAVTNATASATDSTTV
jgi:hypothetical protein